LSNEDMLPRRALAGGQIPAQLVSTYFWTTPKARKTSGGPHFFGHSMPAGGERGRYVLGWSHRESTWQAIKRQFQWPSAGIERQTLGQISFLFILTSCVDYTTGSCG
jgi:hypothetical protein